MIRNRHFPAALFAGLLSSLVFHPGAFAAAEPQILTGQAALGDWHHDHPGVRRSITPGDLPPPYQSRSASESPSILRRPAGRQPQAPAGFRVDLIAKDLNQPRLIRVAPNGDIFVAESGANQIRVFPASILRKMGTGPASPKQQGPSDQGSGGAIFAANLSEPFGIAFFPSGPDPQWVYVANTDSIVRFAYRNGDLRARAAAETIVPHLPEGGHWTRDIAVTPDNQALYVAIGSASNIAGDLPKHDDAWIARWEALHGLGAAWDDEENRANLLIMKPDGSGLTSFANGLRNCVSVSVQPGTGLPWCAVNERDGLGDNLPPDYVTSVKHHAFYGWPWFYIGAHPDPRHPHERPDLAARVTVPDVLIQPHSAPLQLSFYTGSQFPREYRGDAFVALHGSWNRAARTGYKVVRVEFHNGAPTGIYQDFLTGFVVNEEGAWGRPVGVAVAGDGSLLVTEDGEGTLWRIAWTGSN